MDMGVSPRPTVTVSKSERFIRYGVNLAFLMALASFLILVGMAGDIGLRWYI